MKRQNYGWASTIILSMIPSAIALTLWLAAVATPEAAQAVEPGETIVYGVSRAVDLGTGETPQKDYYVSVGARQGVKHGTILHVFRKLATQDLIARVHQTDMVVPVATIKVIHTEGNASVARLEKMFPEAESPALQPRAILVGDLVQLSR